MTEFLTFLTEYNPIMDLIIIVLLGITLGFDIVPFVKNYLCGLFGAKKENGCKCGCECCNEPKDTKETKEADSKFQDFLNESFTEKPDIEKNTTKTTKTKTDKIKTTKTKATKETKTKTDKAEKPKTTKTKTDKIKTTKTKAKTEK